NTHTALLQAPLPSRSWLNKRCYLTLLVSLIRCTQKQSLQSSQHVPYGSTFGLMVDRWIKSLRTLDGGRVESVPGQHTIRLQDEELASLRSAKRFLQIFQHQVPKTSEGIKEQLKHLSQADAPLSPVEFDQLLFTSVYCAYQIRSIQGLDKNLWISFFSQLVDEILHDLCKGFCPANFTLLASWPWKEKPFYLTSLKKSYHSNLAMMKRGTE
uniref:Family with sequence similarity 180 member B n=1 Tax=Chelonoidis abingdonii TaxID=106734 RepID=A0A8C0GBM3_CHEAB